MSDQIANKPERPGRGNVRLPGPLHVALFSPSMTWGGAELMFKRLAVGFAHSGLSTDLVLASADGPNLSELPPAVRIIDLHCRRLVASFGPLLRYLRTANPDVLISTLDHANLLAVWARSAAETSPQLILREANTMSVVASESGDLRDRALPRLARAFYPRADVVVAVSKGVADDLVDNIGIPRSMVRVIYNPTYDKDLASLMKEPVNHPWFGDEGPPLVLSVGRLSAQKRFDMLLRAVAMALEERPIRLLILGDGEERTRLESLARDLGIQDSVSMPGFAQNPYAYMARSNLYVLSSAWEGFPNTLVEAMACGLPVVSTYCPSWPREILGTLAPGPGPLGTLVPVDDPSKLSEAILLSLNTEHDSACLVRQAARYSSERAVRSYIDLMRVRKER